MPVMSSLLSLLLGVLLERSSWILKNPHQSDLELSDIENERSFESGEVR